MAAQNTHVADFLTEVQRRFRIETPDSFWSCEPAFRKLLSTTFLAEVINSELRQLIQDEHYLGNWLPTGLVLHQGDACMLSLSVFDAPQRYIHVFPFPAMHAALSPTGLSYNLYKLPKEYRNEVFDPSLRLEPAGSARVGPGEIVHLRCGEHAYDFSFEAPMLMLKFMASAPRGLEWLFNRDTLRPWQANDADLSFTQLRVAADVLGKIAHQSSLQPLKHMARHPSHSVRWAAIQNIGRLNRSEALVQLKEALNDPHPHLQRAARKTLEKLERK